MYYKALDVADYIVEKCNDLKSSISNLKLQKILYFVQAEFLVAKSQPCFDDEIQAWDFGPVVPSVYFRYKIFGSSNIPWVRQSGITEKLQESDRELVDDIVDQCTKYSAATLVEITHNQTPWLEAYNKPGHNNIISNRSIRQFFMEN